MKIYKTVWVVTFQFFAEDMRTGKENFLEVSAEYDFPPAKKDLNSSEWIRKEIGILIPSEFGKRFAICDDCDFYEVKSMIESRTLVYADEPYGRPKKEQD